MICLKLILFLITFFIPFRQKDIITVLIPEVILQEGESTKIHVRVQVKEGLHIQGNILKDESLIPTTLTFTNEEGLEAGRPIFPPAKKFQLEGAEQSLEVFDGSFEIVLALRTEGLKKGVYQLEASLHYQACDARTCFSPKTKTFFIPVKVTGR
jgi:hypothetical protein